MDTYIVIDHTDNDTQVAGPFDDIVTARLERRVLEQGNSHDLWVVTERQHNQRQKTQSDV